jgi:2-phospho-L-lactate guanylyltransferase
MKATARAKSRLSRVLDPKARAELALWMLDRVLKAAMETDPTSLTVVGGDGDGVSGLVAAWGARLMPEPGRYLNDSLERAMLGLRGPALAPCLILAADLPCLTGDDVRALMAASKDGRVAVIAPALDCRGTNALVVPEDLKVRLQFGLDSLTRHRRLFSRAGRHIVEVRRLGLEFDVDLPEHLDLLRQRCSAELPARFFGRASEVGSA